MGSAIWEKFPKNKFFLHSHLIIQRHVLCLLHFVFNTCPSTFRPLRRIPIMREGQWRGPLCFFHHDLGDSNRDLWHIWKSYIHGVFNYYQRNIYFKNHKLQMLYMNVLLNQQGVFFKTGSATPLHTLSARLCHLGNKNYTYMFLLSLWRFLNSSWNLSCKYWT